MAHVSIVGVWRLGQLFEILLGLCAIYGGFDVFCFLFCTKILSNLAR